MSHRLAAALVAAAGNSLICVNLGSVNKLIAGEGAFVKVDVFILSFILSTVNIFVYHLQLNLLTGCGLFGASAKLDIFKCFWRLSF